MASTSVGGSFLHSLDLLTSSSQQIPSAFFFARSLSPPGPPCVSHFLARASVTCARIFILPVVIKLALQIERALLVVLAKVPGNDIVLLPLAPGAACSLPKLSPLPNQARHKLIGNASSGTSMLSMYTTNVPTRRFSSLSFRNVVRCSTPEKYWTNE